ncbi:GDSL esterase/lipase At5g22810-like [Vicia villosa]|uniref:GDSL esterase/lipase At5g22810-like n=1 Tax=Vicia villosa TaxID=3911 RepID=UPI00273AA368|nr:GDSL esterase/lipase At5g22810-like [Vicia villosa]
MSTSAFSTFFLLVVVFLVPINGKPKVPALFTFGDSSLDVGCNNNLNTLAKANYSPYGRDFENHIPTGRFCNGKLTIDYASETLGFTSHQPPYPTLNIKGDNLLNGASFASSGSGYHESTARLYNVFTMNEQLEFFKDYQRELIKVAGKPNALSIISGGVYLVGAGTGDFLLNYYINPLQYRVYTAYQFSDILVQSYSDFIQKLYALGARKIGVPSLVPIGCLPAAITIFGFTSNKCVSKFNNAAIYFNQRLNSTSLNLLKMLPGLNLKVLETYQLFYDIVSKPSQYGFTEARKGCCGTGLIELSILCNRLAIGTCADASKYVFWDSFHPTDAFNKIMAAHLLSEASPLLS